MIKSGIVQISIFWVQEAKGHRSNNRFSTETPCDTEATVIQKEGAFKKSVHEILNVGLWVPASMNWMTDSSRPVSAPEKHENEIFSQGL